MENEFFSKKYKYIAPKSNLVFKILPRKHRENRVR